MWRSIATAVVRFSGKLDASELRTLQSEAEAAATAGDFSKPPAPAGSVEMIDVNGGHASLGSNAYGEGAWGTLIDHLRRLLGELLHMPQAAIGLEVSPNARSARLVHLGEKPIAVDLSGLSVRAVLWGRGYQKLGDWKSSLGATFGPAQVEARNAWSFTLPFDHGFTPSDDQVVHVYANFAVTEEGQRAEVSVVHAPEVPV
jgi:hypothetical protein